MTSSSEPLRWAPLSLVQGLAPPVESASWLPTLRSSQEERAVNARESMEQAAYERGFADGESAAQSQVDECCRSALGGITRVIEHLESITSEFARDRERDLHGLAIAVARQILQHELSMESFAVVERVRKALELLPLDAVLEIRMNPEDLATLGGSVEGLIPAGRHVRLEWAPDPLVERGGFILESPQRIVDGRTDVALRNLYERLDHD